MLDTPVLAFGITHLTDARYFAAWDADYLCFTLSDTFTLTEFGAIKEWVEGPVCAIEAGAAAGAMPTNKLDIPAILLSSNTDPTPYHEAGIDVILHLEVAGYHSPDDLRERLADHDGPVLLDLAAGGIAFKDIQSGYPFSIDDLATLTKDRRVYLHADITPAEITAALAITHGLAFRGSGEEKVGYKSFDELDEIFEVLEGI